MDKIRRSGLLLFVLSAAALAGWNERRRSQQTAESDDHSGWNFGMVRPKSTLEHSFEIWNRESRPLAFVDVISTCGCTVPVGWDNTPIPPGKSRSLKIEFHPGDSLGEITKRVLVLTDRPSQLVFRVSATVFEPVRAQPSQLSLGTVSVPSMTKRILRLESTIESELAKRVIRITTHPEYLQARIARQQSGQVFVEVGLDDATPVGDFSGQITFEFAPEFASRLVVPVFGRIEGDLRVIPAKLFLTASDSEFPKTQRLRVQSQSQRSFCVTDIVVPSGWSAIQDVENKTPTAMEFTLHIPSRPNQTRAELIQIETDREDQVKLRVLVVQKAEGS